MAESENILTKLQDLLVYLIQQLNKFPRDQKFVLGDRIETKLLDVKEDCLRAYYSQARASAGGQSATGSGAASGAAGQCLEAVQQPHLRRAGRKDG